MDLLSGLIIFFAAGLCLKKTVELLFIPGLSNRYLKSFSCLIPGLLLLEFYLTHKAGFIADMAEYPIQTFVFLTIRILKYSIGPLLFLTYSTLFGYSEIKLFRTSAHFLIQFIAIIFTFIYFVSSNWNLDSFEILKKILWIISDLGFMHLIVYIISIFVYNSFKTQHKFKTVYSKRILTILVITITMTAFLLFYRFTQVKFLETSAYFLISVAIIGWTIFNQIRPDISYGFMRKQKAKTYATSLLNGSNAIILEARLYDLMKSEKIFCDEDLSLDRLAAMMTISKHALSELLNNNIGKSFNDFINQFRIDEAKKILTEEPGRSILSISYSCGFNSKSVFYASFKKFEGITPVQFQKRFDAKV